MFQFSGKTFDGQGTTERLAYADAVTSALLLYTSEKATNSESQKNVQKVCDNKTADQKPLDLEGITFEQSKKDGSNDRYPSENSLSSSLSSINLTSSESKNIIVDQQSTNAVERYI